jgi:hypothetical protein
MLARGYGRRQGEGWGRVNRKHCEIELIDSIYTASGTQEWHTVGGRHAECVGEAVGKLA